MGNRPKPKLLGLKNIETVPLDEWLADPELGLASSTRPLMREIPTQGEIMTDPTPVSIVTDNDPSTPEDTVVTARFNRKKIARIAGVATATLGGLAVFGAVMKARGRNEVLEATEDYSADETTADPA